LYEEDGISPEYLAQLSRDYEEIESGKIELIAGETVLKEMEEDK
jgi:hypothetical protein